MIARSMHGPGFAAVMLLLSLSLNRTAWAEPVSWGEIARLPEPPAAERIAYGADALQFGELRLPAGAGPHPLAIVIHGGCWHSEYDLGYMAHAAEALTRSGVATWTLEYRRIGNDGGGWPGTFEDIAHGADYVRVLAKRYPIDLKRVIALGHSSGGHLALWLAARHRLPKNSPLFFPDPLEVRGVAALAAIADLSAYGTGFGMCNAAVSDLLGGGPGLAPERYAQADPIALLPFGVPQRLLQGARDDIVPPGQSRSFLEKARKEGDDARLTLLEDAGHFDLVAPFSPAWQAVEQAVHDLLQVP
jgi:acetyl esterase/lipase